MKTRNTGLMWIIIIFIGLAWMLSTTDNNQSTSTTSTTPELWRLEKFEDKSVTGLPYDQGKFVNAETGEIYWAKCQDLNAADPSQGDFFTKSGDVFSPVSGASQSFQTFQTIATITPIPTPTIAFSQNLTPQTSLSEEGPKKPLTVVDILVSVVVLILIAVVLFAIARYLWRHGG